jgi:hypothetical protein
MAELEEWLAEGPEAWALLGVDEATGRRHPTLTAQGRLVDEGPEGPTGDDPTPVQVSGAVAPLTSRPHDPVSPELGKGECAPFLPHLLGASPRQRLLVSHDRGAPQKGAPGETVVREAGGRLILKPQPASSPALNPPERLGTWLRRGVTHHHWLATRYEPIEASRHVFRYVAGVTDQVRRLGGLEPQESFVASL